MASPTHLVRVLGLLEQERSRGKIHEYVVHEESGRQVRRRLGAITTRRVVDRYRLEATLYRDTRQGRGSSSFAIGRDEQDVEGVVAAAATQVATAAGLPWRLPPPAAPARVEIADQVTAKELAPAANAIVRAAERALPTGTRLGRLSVDAERLAATVRTSSGLASSLVSTRFAVDGVLVAEQGFERFLASARRRQDLALPEKLRTANNRLAERNRAVPLTGGTYDLVLRGPAIVDDTGLTHSSPYGWFTPFVVQANATLARRGLARYQLGQSIFGSVKPTGDPLTIASDGTLPFGIRSRPLGSKGEPVRRFDLVRRGVAANYALDLREAGLREQPPNGGVRNLVVEPGERSVEELTRSTDRPLVEVIELSHFAADPHSGDFVAEIGLGYLHRGAQTDVIAGGSLGGNLFELFARARLSKEIESIAWYRGPAAIRLDGLAVR